MRHAPRHLPERAQPLCLELLVPDDVERPRQLAQRLAQRLEVGRAPRRRPGRQRQPAADQPGPSDQLVDRSRELPRQMSREPHCREQYQRAEHDDDGDEPAGVVAEVRLRPARQRQGVGDFREVVTHRRALRRGQPDRIDPLQQQSRRAGDLLERGPGPR